LQHQFIPAYAGAIIAITVFGGGLGRTAWQRARGLSRPQALDGSDHLAHSLLTSLSAFAWDQNILGRE